MRWRFERWRRRRAFRERPLPFRERAERRERAFKRIIVATTALLIAAIVGGTRVGRYAVRSLVARGRLVAMRSVGLEPDRDEVEAALRVVRGRSVEATHDSLGRYYRGAEPAMQHLFRATAMDPDHCLIGSGRATNCFMLSPQVFEADDRGRSYRLRPNLRSVWLRQVTLRGGPFGLFLVRDLPEVRESARAAGAVVDEPSAQTTNSWGLRGPEPDPGATARGVVLGDSFMQGMFNGDSDTPPIRLQEALHDLWGVPVSILNTGHIGYAPEQYYRTLEEYGARFRPHFVVVSVCPNDFGDERDVMADRGDDWGEAAYWLGRITLWCRGRAIPCLLVSVPCEGQIMGARKDGRYPGPIADIFEGGGLYYCSPLDQFIDEHLRLRREGERKGISRATSPLYNGHIADNHFSPAGAALWAKVVSHRLGLLMTRPAAGGRGPSSDDEGRLESVGQAAGGQAPPSGRR